jgi:hypothetical protein
VKQRRFYRRQTLLGVFRSGGVSRASVFGACGSLLLQAFILTLHVAQTYSSVNNIGTWASPPICHAIAPEDIPADRNEDPGKKQPSGVPPACPFCVSMHAAGFYLQPALIAVPSPLRADAVSFSSCDDVGAAAPYRTPAQARAPPAKA